MSVAQLVAVDPFALRSEPVGVLDFPLGEWRAVGGAQLRLSLLRQIEPPRPPRLMVDLRWSQSRATYGRGLDDATDIHLPGPGNYLVRILATEKEHGRIVGFRCQLRRLALI